MAYTQPPTREPVINEQGSLSRSWLIWFQKTFNEIGDKFSQLANGANNNFVSIAADGKSLEDSGKSAASFDVAGSAADVQTNLSSHENALDPHSQYLLKVGHFTGSVDVVIAVDFAGQTVTTKTLTFVDGACTDVA